MKAKQAEPAEPIEFIPHPKAIMLPELSEKEYQALKASIAAKGQQRPIQILKGTNYLLGGRHRLRAAQELSMEPEFEEVDIPEERVPVYTAAEAVQRIGVSTSHKVVMAVDLLPELEKQAAERQHLGVKVREGEKGKAAEQAAALVGVSSRYVESGLQLALRPAACTHYSS